MRRYIPFLIFIGALTLAGCEYHNNFFYHPVSFRGEVTEEQLVLTGILHADEKPRLYVNSSRFFQDTVPLDSMFHEGGWNGYYLYYHNPRFLPEAQVEMSVDDGEWQAMYADTFSIAQYGGATGYFFTADKLLRAGEQATFRVRHPRFQQVASVSQQIPFAPQATITALPDSYREGDIRFLGFHVNLPAYRGDTSHFYRFKATTYLTNHEEYQDPDTCFHYTWQESYSYTYSCDMRMMTCQEINKSLSKGYYGSSLGLYAPASHEPTQYQLLALQCNPQYPTPQRIGYDSIWADIDSIVLHVETVTRDEYLHWAKMVQGKYVSRYAPNYFAEESNNNNGMGNIVEDVQDMFDEMGNMEGVQLYDNVEGGIGHVTASTSQCYRYVP
ncbi:MAG: DUF4249 family protein [Paludibacteraceae bacterium]|nr:DUF4249 family protein [Paludibacteraceae bacterium]